MAGNVAFMFLCTIMVLGMTPGLGMFYGGMVRRKNALNTMMFCFAMMGIGMLLWVSIGYSLCFGEDHGGIIGNLHYAFLQNVPWTSDSDEVPPMMLALFNMMFAVISPAIILGSLAERMKFSKMMLLCIIWTLVVYYPLAHMTWGGGFLDDPIGSIDFAGGNVIHISTGVSGLVACMILGKRKGFGAMSYHPHNIPLFLIGAAVLWVGWLGFNCGCAGGANEIAILALANTTISSAASMVVWMLMETILQKKCTVMGAVTGGIVGLVGITPGAGYVPIWSAFLIGAIAARYAAGSISRLGRHCHRIICQQFRKCSRSTQWSGLWRMAAVCCTAGSQCHQHCHCCQLYRCNYADSQEVWRCSWELRKGFLISERM